MPETPLPGVTYTANVATQAWEAPGRASLPFVSVVVIPDPPPPPPTPDPPDPDPPTPDPPPGTIRAGALPHGTSAYTVPAAAIFISPSGNDTTGAGTSRAPYATLAKAIAAAGATATIVARAGTYHEYVQPPASKVLKIQAYPGEKVWFDGSEVYPTWTGSGPWTAAYSIAYDRQMGQGTGISSYGGAATRVLSDQVWINDVPQTQVADGATPAAGQFSVNQGTDTITLGSNPSGKTVRVGTLRQFMVASGRCDLLGIGVRRYCQDKIEFGNSSCYFGGSSAGTIIENCHFHEMAVAAVSITKLNTVIRSNTFRDMGGNAIHVNAANGSIIEKNDIRRINRGMWNPQPVTAAIKIANFDTGVVRYNYIRDCAQVNGIWLDVLCSRYSIYGNDIDGTSPLAQGRSGIVCEMCDGGIVGGAQNWAYVVGNKVANMSGRGVLMYSTGWHRIWNNDLDCPETILLWQDTRGSTPGGGGRVPMRAIHHEIVNNKLKAGRGNNIQFNAYDNGLKVYKGGDMFDRLAGNWFQPTPSGSLAQLGKLGGSRTSYTSLTALAAAATDVGGPLDEQLGTNYQGTSAPASSIADPIPATIASMLGVAAGTRLVGANPDILPIPVEA